MQATPFLFVQIACKQAPTIQPRIRATGTWPRSRPYEFVGLAHSLAQCCHRHIVAVTRLEFVQARLCQRDLTGENIQLGRRAHAIADVGEAKRLLCLVNRLGRGLNQLPCLDQR